MSDVKKWSAEGETRVQVASVPLSLEDGKYLANKKAMYELAGLLVKLLDMGLH